MVHKYKECASKAKKISSKNRTFVGSISALSSDHSLKAETGNVKCVWFVVLLVRHLAS